MSVSAQRRIFQYYLLPINDNISAASQVQEASIVEAYGIFRRGGFTYSAAVPKYYASKERHMQRRITGLILEST